MKTEETPLISFIVPIYNVELYVEKCVKSILNQNYKNIEIILINDGSKDKSGEIIENLGKEDERIKIVHKKNSGVSATRNIGIDLAQGEYILFVDGDDYVDNDYAEYFYRLIKLYDSSIAMGLNKFTIWNAKQVIKDFQRNLNSQKVIELIYLEKINVAVWNKIYKKSFLVENKIKFNENIWYGEGMLFNIECLQCTSNVAIGEKKIYHQVFNPKSAMRDFNLKSNFCGIMSLEIQRDKWIVSSEEIVNAWDYHYRCFSFSILKGLIKTKKVEENQNLYKDCIRKLRHNIFLPCKVKISIGRKMFYLALAVCPVGITKIAILKEKRAKKKANRLLDNRKENAKL